MRIVRSRAILAAGPMQSVGASLTALEKKLSLCSTLANAARNCFPEPGRKRTLLLVLRDSPYYVTKLTHDEQAAYGETAATTVEGLKDVGFSAQEIGRNYSPDDYVDRCHLSEVGGKRLAEDVAPTIRDLAERLGYLQKGASR